MTRKEINQQFEELHRLRTQDPQQALALSEELISASIAIKFSEHLPQLRLYRADLLERVSRQAESEEEYHRCIEIGEQLDNKLVVGRAVAGLGALRFHHFDLPGAKELLERAISIAISAEDMMGKGIALANLADIYKEWGLRELAAGYAKDAYEALKDTDSITLPLYRLAALSNAAGDFESAKNFFSEGLEYIEKRNIKTAKSPFHAELGSTYARMGELKKANEEYQRSQKFAEEIGDTDNIINAMLLLGANYIDQKDYDSAEAQFQKTMTVHQSDRTKMRTQMWSTYYGAMIAYHRGNPKETVRILNEQFPESKSDLKNQLTEGIISLYGEAYTLLADWQNAALSEKKLREFREKTNSEQFKSKLTTAQALIATEREKHDKELEKMKREQLERELSNTTLQLLAQTEALSEFREGILAVVRKAPPTEPIAKELREKLKVLPCKSIDWDKFEAQFKAAHPEFRLRLIELYPELTKMELRICTLIRMNLKSDDISRLTCLSERNIENHRYRIRKKMKLVKEQDLAQELMKM